MILGRHHEPIAYVDFEPSGAGRLVTAARRAGLVTHPGSLALGRLAVPHPADNADVSDRLRHLAELAGRR